MQAGKMPRERLSQRLSLAFKSLIERTILTRPFAFRGFAVVPTRFIRHVGASTHLARILDRYKIDTVLDVGANTGQYRDYLRNIVRFKGRVISFEPIPAHVAELERRATLDANWHVCGYALGAKPGEAMFNVMRDTQFSSFHQPDDSSTKLFEKKNAISEQITVRVATLDVAILELEKQHGALGNLYLKMDTQGFDLEVVGGATSTLGRIFALQTEASVTQIYHGMPGYEETIRRLRLAGFELSGIYPNNDGNFPWLIEFDCYMVKVATA